MNIFLNIFNSHKRKTFIALLEEEERKLCFFKVQNINSKTIEKFNKICKNRKNIDLIKKFNFINEKVKFHNKKVKLLTDKFIDSKNYWQNNNFEHEVKTKSLDNLNLRLKNELEVFEEIFQYKNSDEFICKQDIEKIKKSIELIPLIKQQKKYVEEIQEIINSYDNVYIDMENANFLFSEIRKLNKINSKLPAKFFKLKSKIDNKWINAHNELFIEKNLNNTIFDNINGKSLDEDQRRAILCDSKSNLVIAGAGSGKTLTICGKIKWLLYNGIKPSEILLLSYSADSVDDLQNKCKKINKSIKVKTFHSLGKEILKIDKNPIESIESIIQSFLENNLTQKTEIGQKIFKFYSLFLYQPEINDKKCQEKWEEYEKIENYDFKTLKDILSFTNTNNQKTTMKREMVRSIEELVIANWLFMNGIKYEYESVYKHKINSNDRSEYTPDFYLPDYQIYIEHFGINSENKTPQYSKKMEDQYLKDMAWKREVHKKYGTNLIETYSYEFSNQTIFHKLEKKLKIKTKNRIDEEIFKRYIECIFDNKNLLYLKKLLLQSVNLYKSNFLYDSGFEKILNNFESKNTYQKFRTNLFLEICKEAFLFYKSEIQKQGKIDFDYMILKTIEVINDLKNYKYKYVLVDEFQDISWPRFKFLKKILEHGNSKIFAVGDDWQSIYRFAGSDINIFLNFAEEFEDAKINKISMTYRNSQEMQTIMQKFIQKNKQQIEKSIKSSLHEKEPIRIIYDNSKSEAFKKVLTKINQVNPNSKILILGRNKSDVETISSKDIQIEKVKKDDEQKLISSITFNKLKMTFKTIHKSKGLEEDYVILINGENKKDGLPNKMEDDEIINIFLPKKDQYDFAEERRLFYVAITRAKKVAYILSNINNPSIFVKEIDTEHINNINSKKYKCPICDANLRIEKVYNKDKYFWGCPYRKRCGFKFYGNEDDLKRNKICPKCKKNYLIVKTNSKTNKQFLGCCGKGGCGYTESFE